MEILGRLGAAALSAVVLLLSACSADGEGGGVTVPDVVGLPLAEATSRVESVGLKVRGTGAVESDPQHPAAIVVAQEPPAGADVPGGSLVGFRTRAADDPGQHPAGDNSR